MCVRSHKQQSAVSGKRVRKQKCKGRTRSQEELEIRTAAHQPRPTQEGLFSTVEVGQTMGHTKGPNMVHHDMFHVSTHGKHDFHGMDHGLCPPWCIP